ncbi:SWEET sugar transporter [Dillenia turbinata]|uniref:Bidirectional sugar transporter SWEET n=1 Tax=Dillenia turbinata TaxID=194707 RepID=A0AAN8ZBP8_9MAGN
MRNPSGFLYYSAYSMCSDAAGIAGNLFAFVLFVSPIPTFRRIIRNRSTEQFSGLPYIYALLNCLICLWYGMPLVSPGILLVATVNSVGAMFQLAYIAIFVTYAEKGKKMKMMGLLLGVFCLFSIIVFVSMRYLDSHTRQLFVGYLSVASLISMFASPLFIINLVIQTRSVEYMPFYLSLSTFLMIKSPKMNQDSPYLSHTLEWTFCHEFGIVTRRKFMQSSSLMLHGAKILDVVKRFSCIRCGSNGGAYCLKQVTIEEEFSGKLAFTLFMMKKGQSILEL